MKIGVNTLSVVPDRVGGGETFLANLVSAMATLLPAGDELVLFTSKDNERLFPSPKGVRRIRVAIPGGSRPVRLLAEHLLLPGLLTRSGVRVLISPGNALPPLAGVRQVLVLQSLHYLHVAADMSRFRVAYFRRMVPIACGRASRVVCVSEDLRRNLARVAPRASARSLVIHEGADLGAFSPEGPGEPGRYLLYVSSLNRFKRPDSLVRALARLRREGFAPPRAILAGRPDPPDRERVLALSREEGVEDLVQVVGVVPHDRLPALYRGAALLVYPSAVETFGLPPLEAMACGVPVVASNRTAVPEVVGDAAIVVDPDDIGALAGAIRRGLTDPVLRRELVEKGFRNLRRFDWTRAAAALLGVARAAAGEPTCRTPGTHLA